MTLKRTAAQIVAQAEEEAERLYPGRNGAAERLAFLRGVRAAYIDAGRPEDGPLAKALAAAASRVRPLPVRLHDEKP